jgi:hypothetical protein
LSTGTGELLSASTSASLTSAGRTFLLLILRVTLGSAFARTENIKDTAPCGRWLTIRGPLPGKCVFDFPCKIKRKVSCSVGTEIGEKVLKIDRFIQYTS